MVKALFFGVLAEACGTAEMELNNITSTDVLRAHILEHVPQLADYTFRIAVNQELTEGDVKLNSNDTVAFMPPFAGG